MKRNHKIFSAAALALLVSWNSNALVYSQQIVGGGESSVSAFVADIGVLAVSTVTTNELGAILTTDTFTRGGQTNLIRVTKVQDGAVVFRSQQFCHDGQPAALFTFRDGFESFHTVPNTPYHVDLEFSPSKEVRCVIVRGRDFIDGFYPTNGVFYPAPNSDLEKKDYKR